MSDCIATRDCIKDPIKKECRKFCLERILRTATPEEKRLILGYSHTTANAIFNAYNNFLINSYDDLQRHLTQEQEREILAKFDQINQFQIDYFQLSREQRDTIIRTIRNLGLDMN